MWQLTVNEFKKILNKKIVYGALLFLVFFDLLFFQGWSSSWERTETAEGEVLEGTEGVRYMQEEDRKYAGELTDEKVKEVLFGLPGEPSVRHGGYYQLDIYDYLERTFRLDKTGNVQNSVEEIFTPEMGTIHLGYNKSFSCTISFLINIMLTLGIIIIIAVSPVFSEEYTKRTDALILTSKYGKGKAAGAKIGASFLFAGALYVITLLLHGIFFLAAYGTEGWNTSVQIDWIGYFAETPYEMNYAQLTGYAAILWFAAIFLLTGMTVFLSAVGKTSFISLILASACFVIPVWVERIIPDWLDTMMPALQISLLPVTGLQAIHIGAYQIMPLWIVVAVSAAVTIVFGISAAKCFDRHQVVS